MRRNYKIVVLIALLTLPSFVMSGAYERSRRKTADSKDDLYAQIELFADAISVIRADYVDKVESKKLIYGALKGMLSSLDDFSQFMEPDEYKEIRLGTKGEFSGIGVEISFKDGILTIVAPIAGTPADAAGIQPGDKIVKIDGVITEDMTLDEAVKKMRGEPGTTVTLTVWREKAEKIFDIIIKRAVIKIQSVREGSLVEDKIGYIRLIEFKESTPRDLEDALRRLEKEGMDSLILDLRNNPGGLLDVAAEVAEKFLEKDKVIVSTKSRSQNQDMTFKSKGRFRHPDYPLVILVNEGSASASEIVAGAIQDNRRGIILGTRTFGKGSVQTVVPLKDGSALRLTTASYFTPSGRMIRNQGVIPDVIVEKDELGLKLKEGPRDIFKTLEAPPDEKSKPSAVIVEKKEPLERDAQLERAIDLIKAIKVYRTL